MSSPKFYFLIFVITHNRRVAALGTVKKVGRFERGVGISTLQRESAGTSINSEVPSCTDVPISLKENPPDTGLEPH